MEVDKDPIKTIDDFFPKTWPRKLEIPTHYIFDRPKGTIVPKA